MSDTVQGKILTSRKRLFVIMVVLTTLFLLLLIRVGYWSLIKGPELEKEAQGQWISDTVVSAQRGSIFDRSGNVLAQSAGADTVVLMPKEVKDAQKVASGLAGILGLDEKDIYEKAITTTRIDSEGKEKPVVEVWLKRQITAEQSQEIKDLKLEGVKLIADVRRYYPNRAFASQVIGYTSLDGEGQSGIERRFNSILEGRQGRAVSETDGLNNEIPNGDEMIIEPVDGQNVVLTLNEVIQSYLEEACGRALEDLDADSVQGTVMDVPTREILAMANVPEFDLNEPPRSDSERLAREGTNIVTARAFEPGNIFTIFTAAAAQDSNNVAPNYSCTGSAIIDGAEITCPDVHGEQTFEEAVHNRCLVAAANMAADMGMRTFYKYLEGFGFGRETGIEFTSDNSGHLMEMKYATEAETAKMGSGTALKLTQLQFLDAMAALLDGGTVKSPQLVLKLQNADGTVAEEYETQTQSAAVDSDTAQKMQSILGDAEALLDGYGSGSVYGSALQPQDSLENIGSGRVSMYCAFAPLDDPKYLVLITVNTATDVATDETAAESYVQDVLENILQYAGVQPSVASVPSPSPTPSGTLPPYVKVPRLVGLDMDSALELIESEGLEMEKDGTGTVIGQFPYAGTEVDRGSTVQLEMSVTQRDPEGSQTPSGGQTTVPDFTGMSFEDAMETALSAGLTFYAQGTGKAVAQVPIAGAAVERGTSVTVTFRIDAEVS